MTYPPGYVYGSEVLVKHLPRDCKRGAIIGVWKGVDAQNLLEHCPQMMLYLVDDWSLRGIPEPGRFKVENVRAEAFERLAPYRERTRWLESSSDTAYWCLAGQRRLDFVYIDGDHDALAVRADIELWHSTVVVGGILAGHDYGHPDFPGVKQAVDAAGLDFELEGTVWIHTKD